MGGTVLEPHCKISLILKPTEREMTKVLNRGLVLFKKEGQIVPELMIQKIVASYPSPAAYIAQITGEKGEPLLDVPTEAEPPSVEAIMEMMKAAKDYDVYFYFSNLPENTPAQNFQPFMIDAGDQENALAIMVEGDFPSYEGDKEGNTPEFVLTNKIIIPTLKDILELSGDDLSKFAEKLKSSSLFENVFQREIGHRGVCTIVPVGHDGVTFGKNELSLIEDWGWSTQELGFKAEVEQAPVEDKKPVSKFSIGKKAKPAEAKVEAKKDEKLAPGVHRVPESKASVPPVAPPKETAEDEEQIAVPNSLHGKSRKQYIRKILGLAPNDHIPYTKAEWMSKDFVITRKKATVVKDFKDIPKAVGSEAPKAATAVSTVKDAATKVEANKMTQMQETAKAVTGASAKEIKEVQEIVLGYLSAIETKQITPNDVQMLEGNVKLFSEQVGCNTSDLLFMPKAEIGRIVASYPALAIALIMELRKNWINTGNIALAELAGTATPAKEEEKPAASANKFNIGKKKVAA